MLTLRETPDGVMANIDGEEGTTVGMADIDAICSILVNGRDWEDGMAPVEVIAAIIEKRLGCKAIAMPPLPPWLEDVPSEELSSLTPMEAALASLPIFGGESTDGVLIAIER